MQVKHYMVRSVATVRDRDTMGEALATMIKQRRQALLVVDQDDKYVGEITSFTLARLLLPPESDMAKVTEQPEFETLNDVDDRITPHLGRHVADFAEGDVPVMYPDTPLVEAIKLLAGGALRLPVVEPETKKLLGAISSLTVLRRYQF